MSLQARINICGKSLKETSNLNFTTFEPQNADIPHFITLDCSALYSLVDKRNIDVCQKDYCSDLLLSLGLSNVALVKLNCILGGFKERFPNHNECVICARKRTALYIKTYNLNPKEAKEKFDHSMLIFDYVNVVGGYNRDHVVCYNENFFMGSKKNEYTVSFDKKYICNPPGSEYVQSLN